MADSDKGSSGSGAMNADAAEAAQLSAKKTELEEWRKKVEKEDDRKSRLLLEKMQKQDDKLKAKQELELCVSKEEEQQKAFSRSMTSLQEQILRASERKRDLQEQLRRCQEQLQARRADSSRLQQRFRIGVKVPDTPLNFSGRGGQEESEGRAAGPLQPIRETFSIMQRAAATLGPAQALLTFEKDAVASRVLQLSSSSIPCEGTTMGLRTSAVRTEPAVKFEVHLHVSRKEVQVSHVPPSCPPEQAKLLLELSFSRPSLGGAEVEEVTLEPSGGGGGSGDGGARVSFLRPGAAERLALSGRHQLHLQPQVSLKVEPVYTFSLQKFQTFCGRSSRSVVLDQIREQAPRRGQDTLDEEELQDLLEIYFQKPGNSGGEIDTIKLLWQGTQQAFFCEELDG